MEKPLITVAIPTYNTPLKFFDVCLKQIINQTYNRLDIFIVDDGSEEWFVNHLVEIGEKDSRIRLLFNKENKGIHKTRDLILKNVIGDFLLFVDSDDFVKNDFVESLYESYLSFKKENAFVYCKRIAFRNEQQLNDLLKRRNNECDYSVSKKDLLHRAARGGIGTNIWGRLIPYHFLSKLSVSEENGCDDGQLLPQLALVSDGAVVCKTTAYYYRQRSGSLVHQNNYTLYLHYNLYKYYKKISEEHDLGSFSFLDIMIKLNEYRLCCVDYNDSFSYKNVKYVASDIKKQLEKYSIDNFNKKTKKILKLVTTFPHTYAFFYRIYRGRKNIV